MVNFSKKLTTDQVPGWDDLSNRKQVDTDGVLVVLLLGRDAMDIPPLLLFFAYPINVMDLICARYPGICWNMLQDDEVIMILTKILPGWMDSLQRRLVLGLVVVGNQLLGREARESGALAVHLYCNLSVHIYCNLTVHLFYNPVVHFVLFHQ